MKQTLEEAAKENILFNHRTVDRTLSGSNLAQFGITNFIQGAEWQSKQSPWISVKEKEPIINEPILAMLGDKVVIITLSGWDSNEGCHPFITHWMPIPPLESNGNELKRNEK